MTSLQHASTEPLQEDSFSRSLHACYAASLEEDSLKLFKAKAWNRFLEIGLPQKKKESYQYVPLRKLYAQEFREELHADRSHLVEKVDSYILEECQGSCLVFVDGHFEKSLSKTDAIKKKIVLKHLSEAYRTYGTFLNNHFHQVLKVETDPFIALNMALSEKAAFFYVPPKVKVEVPVQVLHLVTGKTAFNFPRLQAFIGADSEVSFITTTHVLVQAPLFINQVHDFIVEESAQVECFQAHAPSNAWHFEYLRAQLKKESCLKSVSKTSGAKAFRQDYRLSLVGEHAECSFYGLWHLEENKEAHTHVFIEHVSPNCKSLQLFKGVLNDTSKSSFEGKIYVHSEAQKTDAFQLNNHLFLSPHVLANSKPNLEIFADDVKASHGATFGRINEDSLFYLKARGIDDAKAKELLIQGFEREVLDHFPVKVDL